MSDYSTNDFANTGARGSIHGRIYWDNGRHTDFIYARIVNGEERKADYIMLDNERYERVRECEYLGYDDGLDENLDGEIVRYGPQQVFLSCHDFYGDFTPNYCPICGARVKGGGDD